jgi:hypothetical protein
MAFHMGQRDDAESSFGSYYSLEDVPFRAEGGVGVIRWPFCHFIQNGDATKGVGM